MTPDPRTHPYDPQRRWAEALPGQPVPSGWRALTPLPRWAAYRAPLRSRPEEAAPQISEALPGEALELLAEEGGWGWARTLHDRYLGWTPLEGLLELRPGAPLRTQPFRVQALRAHAYEAPRVSSPVLAELCWGAVLGASPEGPWGEVTEEGRRWVPVRLPTGEPAWVGAEVLRLGPPPATPADFALRFLETPYRWGGRSAWGLDCSGLSQLAYAACGHSLPRDSDQQATALAPTQAPRRGDLAFFPGHVAVVLGALRPGEVEVVHASAAAMRVQVDRLGEGEIGARLARELLGYGRWDA